LTKRPGEVELMAHSGALLAQVFGHLDRLDLVGMTTMQVNDLVERLIVEDLGARPASKGQYGYAYAINSSPNQVVCHGVPSSTEVLVDGDIVNFDITLEKNGWIADSSKTYFVGSVDPAARRLVQTAYEALWKGIKAVRPGATLGDVGHVIERHARNHGCSVVREYCGHRTGPASPSSEASQGANASPEETGGGSKGGEDIRRESRDPSARVGRWKKSEGTPGEFRSPGTRDPQGSSCKDPWAAGYRGRGEAPVNEPRRRRKPTRAAQGASAVRSTKTAFRRQVRHAEAIPPQGAGQFSRFTAARIAASAVDPAAVAVHEVWCPSASSAALTS
jgi:methionine aminopeptidase type I